MMKIKLSICLLVAFLATFSYAANIKLGEIPASVSIDDGGEIIPIGDDFEFKKWDTGALAGRVGVVQHLAARMGINKLNQPLMDALSDAAFPREKFLVATIVNIDDAMWGTGGIVSGELEKNKKDYPSSIIVADQEGIALKAWGLKKKNSAITVVNAEGKVIFFKEGALDETEIESVVEMIRELI